MFTSAQEVRLAELYATYKTTIDGGTSSDANIKRNAAFKTIAASLNSEMGINVTAQQVKIKLKVRRGLELG